MQRARLTDRLLIQGKHFDGYEMCRREEKLCNVTVEVLDNIEQGDLFQIDFDGDGKVKWNARVTKKDRENKWLYYFLT